MVEITGYRVGDIGKVVALQSAYYDRHWQLGRTFEAIMARDMGEFMSRFDASADGAWIARDGEKIIGSIFVDGSNPEGVMLRYFLLDDDYQGLGLGKKLMGEAMAFAGSLHVSHMTLWTHDGLLPAVHLYEKYGFKTVESRRDIYWGANLNRLKMVKRFQRRIAA
jgi:GNAT superfamily N-acetyltransferase